MRIPDKLAAMVAALVFASVFAFGVLHVWTTIAAYRLAGLDAAAISAGLPIIAEVYWAVVCWRTPGYSTLYPVAVAVVLAVGAVSLFLVRLANRDQTEILDRYEEPAN